MARTVSGLKKQQMKAFVVCAAQTSKVTRMKSVNLEHVYEVTRNRTKTNTVNETHTHTTARTYFLRILSFYLMFSHLILKNARRNVYNGEMGSKQKGALSWQF
jgi:hypothetical protein